MAVLIGRGIAKAMFNNQALVMVPNCSWTGHECDVLVVTKDLRVIDVEIKASFADLKRDAGKAKWWRWVGWHAPKTALPWPNKVWKHWYVVSESVWRDGVALTAAASENSGFAVYADGSGAIDPGTRWPPSKLLVMRNPKPNKDASTLTPAQALDVARLASLRLWDEYARASARFSKPRHVLAKPAP